MNHLIKEIFNNEWVWHPSDSLGDHGIDEGVKCIVRLTFSLAEKVWVENVKNARLNLLLASLPLDRDYAIQQIRDLSDLVGLNQTKGGLRSFCSKCWRKRVQTILERDEYHINPNHVSLILQAKPRGRDAHYSITWRHAEMCWQATRPNGMSHCSICQLRWHRLGRWTTRFHGYLDSGAGWTRPLAFDLPSQIRQ